MQKLIQKTKFDNIRSDIHGDIHSDIQVTAAKGYEMSNGRSVFWPLVSVILLATIISVMSIQRSLPALLLPAAQASEKAFVEIERSRGLPVRGQSRANVRSRFGDPVNSKPSVGDPPISSWVYKDFTVYFEYDLVITSVATDDHLPSALGDIQ